MFSRRTFVVSGAALMAVPRARAAGWLGEDGLFQQDWFVDSFLDLAEDIANASARGKRLAVLWGLKGCPACKRMHHEHFQDATLTNFLKTHFDILHLNILGSREVTDVDGRKFGEKDFAGHYGIRSTPSVQFFPKSTDGLAKLEPQKREVLRMPGLLEPKAFLGMFRFVQMEAYLGAGFADWFEKNKT